MASYLGMQLNYCHPFNQNPYCCSFRNCWRLLSLRLGNLHHFPCHTVDSTSNCPSPWSRQSRHPFYSYFLACFRYLQIHCLLHNLIINKLAFNCSRIRNRPFQSLTFLNFLGIPWSPSAWLDWVRLLTPTH